MGVGGEDREGERREERERGWRGRGREGGIANGICHHLLSPAICHSPLEKQQCYRSKPTQQKRSKEGETEFHRAQRAQLEAKGAVSSIDGSNPILSTLIVCHTHGRGQKPHI